MISGNALTKPDREGGVGSTANCVDREHPDHKLPADEICMTPLAVEGRVPSGMNAPRSMLTEEATVTVASTYSGWRRLA